VKDFAPYRSQVIGIDQEFATPCGEKRIIYADWTASGRLYRPIEEFMAESIGPFVGNTHTETTVTGTRMTSAYHQAQQVIKRHVHANDGDAIFFSGFGMTAVINKLQRLLGLRIPEQYCGKLPGRSRRKPLVVLTHMEHHSNHTTWNECYCHVEIVRRDRDGLPDLGHLEAILKKHAGRDLKIGSFSACSNVTGILTPYREMAAIMHRHGGYCFVDFAASAPYVAIDMHPADPAQRLDAIFFSPHKFLGGPGASGVMLLSKEAVPQPRSRPSRRRHRALDRTPGASSAITTTSRSARTAAPPASCRRSAPPWPSSSRRTWAWRPCWSARKCSRACC